MKTIKSHQKSEYRSLIVGLILTCITGFLLFIIGKNKTISEFEQGLFFIIGLTTMAALSAFKHYVADVDRTNHFLNQKYDISLKKKIQNIKQKLKKKYQNLQVILKDYHSEQELIELEQSLLKKQQDLFSIEKILLEKEQDNFSIQEKLKEIELYLDRVDGVFGQNVQEIIDEIKAKKIKVN